MSERAKAIIEAYVGSSITATSAAWNWLGNNHDQITSICAIIGACIAIHAFYTQRKIKKQSRKKPT